jgi:hypothetical protein
MGESGVEQERFPQPWLSQQGDTFLPGLQAINNSLYDDLMAPTQKEYAWSGRVRERVLLQVIKIEKHDCTTPSLKNNSYAEDIRVI